MIPSLFSTASAYPYQTDQQHPKFLPALLKSIITAYTDAYLQSDVVRKHVQARAYFFDKKQIT